MSWRFFRVFYETVMYSGANGHLWFMYPLFGMLLSTPFLSKMLHNMNEKELKILWRVAIGFNIVNYFLCADLGVGFRVLSWVFDGWIIYYFAGYYYRHVACKESNIKWIVLGLTGLVITVLGKEGMLPFLNRFVVATDIQPMFTLFCMGYLFCFDKAVKITSKFVQKAVLFLSRNTYLIYLFHMQGIAYVTRKLNIVEQTNLNGFIVVFGAFFVSLIVAVVVNFFMKSVQKWIDRVWIIKQ